MTDPYDDPTTKVLHNTAGLLLEMENVMRNEQVRRALETHMLNAGTRIATLRQDVLREWNRRSLANRVETGGVPQ